MPALRRRDAKLVSASQVYGQTRDSRGKPYGDIWICPAGHDCRVGAHPDGRPKGTLAGPALRTARMDAHAAFDGWWKAEGISRSLAYRRLANIMNVDPAHIGEFDLHQCRYVQEMFAGGSLAIPAHPNCLSTIDIVRDRVTPYATFLGYMDDPAETALALSTRTTRKKRPSKAEAWTPGERAIKLREK